MLRQPMARRGQLGARAQVAMADGVWCAKRYHDVTHVLTANTVAGLAEQIQHDYAELAG